MKTKSIPTIIMLLGGAVACVLGLINQYEPMSFFTMILGVLVVFYVLGCVVKMILDKNFKVEEDVILNEVLPEEEKENIESESVAEETEE